MPEPLSRNRVSCSRCSRRPSSGRGENRSLLPGLIDRGQQVELLSGRTLADLGSCPFRRPRIVAGDARLRGASLDSPVRAHTLHLPFIADAKKIVYGSGSRAVEIDGFLFDQAKHNRIADDRDLPIRSNPAVAWIKTDRREIFRVLDPPDFSQRSNVTPLSSLDWMQNHRGKSLGAPRSTMIQENRRPGREHDREGGSCVYKSVRR